MMMNTLKECRKWIGNQKSWQKDCKNNKRNMLEKRKMKQTVKYVMLACMINNLPFCRFVAIFFIGIV